MADERITDDELAKLIGVQRVVAAHEALGPNVSAARWSLCELRALEELRDLRRKIEEQNAYIGELQAVRIGCSANIVKGYTGEDKTDA